jgi:hypothetical protein
MDELARGIWRWTAPHPEWKPAQEWGHEVASFALESPDVLVLVDPQAPPEAEPFWTELDGLCEKSEALALMVTIPYHVRSCAAIYDRYRDRMRVSVWGHEAARRRLARTGTPVELAEPGNPLPAGAQAFAIGSPRRQELPMYFPAHRALAFGDAVVALVPESLPADAPPSPRPRGRPRARDARAARDRRRQGAARASPGVAALALPLKRPKYNAPHADVAQLAEHRLPKPRVAGSIPVVRSQEGPAQTVLSPSVELPLGPAANGLLRKRAPGRSAQRPL